MLIVLDPFARRCVATGLILASLGASAWAQSEPERAPGVIVGGSQDVSIGGLPTARAGDAASNGGHVNEGSPNVFINGRPAARVGDRAGCGVVVRGAGTVTINGMPAGRVGDNTSGC